MNLLVIGLGSMGKRRIRCLKSLGIKNICGFDRREDRREATAREHQIPVYDTLGSAVAAGKPDALIISVPPDQHTIYMEFAVAKQVPFFVEASVIDSGLDRIETNLAGTSLVAAPSCTLLFHPAIQMIGEIVRTGELGKLSNVLLHSGQFLPDWHTYEKVSDYYVSNPATGGAREIVPFELTWIVDVFGFPRRVASNFRKTIDIPGAEYIEDTYNCLLDWGTYLGVLTVDVVSRSATRRLTINGSKKQLCWSWDENCIKIFNPDSGKWEQREYSIAEAHPGYNKNISESMYIDEVAAFLAAIKGEKQFPNTLAKDRKVLQTLYACEKADQRASYEVLS